MWGSVQGPDHKSADIQVKDGERPGSESRVNDRHRIDGQVLIRTPGSTYAFKPIICYLRLKTLKTITVEYERPRIKQDNFKFEFQRSNTFWKTV